MRFKLYHDVHAFYQETYSVLMRHEAQNLVPLGNVILGHEGKDITGWRDSGHWFMATVSDDAGIRITAVMTPPFKLTLYATDNQNDEAALSCLIDGIIKTGCPIPGVMAESALAESFAKAYTAVTGMQYQIRTSQRIYELTQVNPAIPPAGILRLARESDMAFLPYWMEGFQYDCFGSPPNVQNDAESYRYHIAAKNLFILEHSGTPVSMAKAHRSLRTVCGVGHVYTPPYFRGQGFATTCVAAVSRIILERGYAKCALYTDLANPTSNSIYQKIGYTPICDSLDIRFEPRTAPKP